MKISLAMATFDGAAYLSEQLQSLTSQTLLPDEMIISDDASSDATMEIVSEFRRTAPFPVTVRRNASRLGYAKNFVAAAESTSGDLVMFADQDDIWLPDKIGTVGQHAKADGALVYLHDLSIIYQDGRPPVLSYYKHLEEAGFPRAACFKGCTMAIKRGFVEAWGWPAPESGITHDFWPAIIASGLGRIHRIEEPLLRHRIHGSNTSGWIVGPGSTRPKPWGRHHPGDTEAMLDLCIGSYNVAWLDVLQAKLAEGSDPRDPARDRFLNLLNAKKIQMMTVDG